MAEHTYTPVPDERLDLLARTATAALKDPGTADPGDPATLSPEHLAFIRACSPRQVLALLTELRWHRFEAQHTNTPHLPTAWKSKM